MLAPENLKDGALKTAGNPAALAPPILLPHSHRDVRPPVLHPRRCRARNLFSGLHGSDLAAILIVKGGANSHTNLMSRSKIFTIAVLFVAVVAFNVWSLSSVNDRLGKIEDPAPVLNQLRAQIDEQTRESASLAANVSDLTRSMAELEIEVAQSEEEIQQESFERKDLTRRIESQAKASEEIQQTLTEISRRMNELANDDRINRNSLAEQENARAVQTDKEAEPIRAKIARLETDQERILARIRLVSTETLPPSRGESVIARAASARRLQEWKRKATDDLQNELQPVQRALEAEYARLDALKQR